MSLTPGLCLGPYEILGAIGAGGMGEVYRARDAKLNRDVALKVLPESLAGDPDRLARFRREAQVLAALNHPNIAHIHGFEDSGATHALVMELVDGPTLADRIAQGPMPFDEALPVARQIADALESAHEQGIIHRDLKPANIKIRPDGTVKVLDFGLAKALDPTSGSGAEVMNSPTLTARATQMGMILGTAAYMAPEQARGKPVDRRADIWAFGVVLYEMLTGRRAFEGDDISITLANVLKDDVTWAAVPVDVPAPVRRLLRRCLEKDPKRRLSAIGDARLELEDAASRTTEDVFAAPLRATPAAPFWRRALPWTLLVIVSAGLVAAMLVWSPWRSTPVQTPRKLLASIGAEASFGTNFSPYLSLSPDGTTLAFAATQAGQLRLFVRRLDQLNAVPLAGSEGAAAPFFSPDGQWIAFVAQGKLKKVSVTGGAAISLCDAPSLRGGTWAGDDAIIFTPSAAPDTRLMRVPAGGGTPTVWGTLSAGAVTQRWPQTLPGDAGVLYTEHSAVLGEFDAANLVVMARPGGTPKIVLRGGYFGRYLPSGHLIYMQQGTLFAVRFDLSRLETEGQAVPVLEGIAASPVAGSAQIALSSDGTLAYLPGGVGGAITNRAINWLTRDGKVSPLTDRKGDWANLRFSPDGQKAAVEINDGKHSNIWVYERARDTLTQLTFDAGRASMPVWTPDGRRIVFASDRAKPGTLNLYWMNADGTGGVTRLIDSPITQFPTSWHSSGKFLAFFQVTGASNLDLMILPMDGDATRGWTPGQPTVFLGTPATEFSPMFSPDGRWIAYASNEGGAMDVYVRPFPGPGGPWRISTEGGIAPRWSATTRELLFLSQSKVFVAPYAVVGDSFRADKPQPWAPGASATVNYDIHPDGKRLGFVAAADQSGIVQDKVVFVWNFFDYLRQTVPAGKR